MTPSGPRKFFRKAVSSLNDWLKEAEEERDSLAEDLSVPPSNAKSASAPLQPSPPPFSTKAKNEDPKPPPVYELDGAETQPLDPAKTPHLKSNQRESSGSIVPQMYSNQRRIAGLKRRVDASPDSEIHKILTHSRNDTAYVERDEIVRLVRERYERYGETVASSVLTRALMPKGIEMILKRLDLTSLGSIEADHEQICDIIELHGVEDFCRALGIHYDPDELKREQRRVAETRRREAQARLRERQSKQGGKGPFLNADGVKPLSLPPEVHEQFKEESTAKPLSLRESDKDREAGRAKDSRPQFPRPTLLRKAPEDEKTQPLRSDGSPEPEESLQASDFLARELETEND